MRCLWQGSFFLNFIRYFPIYNIENFQGFRTKASHDLHILGHSEPTIPCEVCGRLLTNKKTLTGHLKTHSGERKYKCTFEGCNKAFTKCSGLQVHVRSHTKERVCIITIVTYWS